MISGKNALRYGESGGAQLCGITTLGMAHCLKLPVFAALKVH